MTGLSGFQWFIAKTSGGVSIVTTSIQNLDVTGNTDSAFYKVLASVLDFVFKAIALNKIFMFCQFTLAI